VSERPDGGREVEKSSKVKTSVDPLAGSVKVKGDVSWEKRKQLVDKEWSGELDLKAWIKRRLGRKGKDA
jgi:hypothetical protein